MTIRERALEAKGELTQSTFKWAAKVITLAAFVTCYVLVLAIIAMCYLNPEKTVLIATNLHGEALIELLIFWSTVPFVIYNLKDFIASFFSARAHEKLYAVRKHRAANEEAEGR